MAKMPAFQFYPGDWRRDPGVNALTRHDRSVWFDILCIMHESDERGVLLLGGMPMPEEALAQILNLDNQVLIQTLSKILTYGVASRRQEDGAIICRRMVRDEKLCKVRRAAGKTGGNPVLVNQKSSKIQANAQPKAKQMPTPSSSSSSSTTKPIESFALPEWIRSDTWNAYLEIRSSKGAKKTVHAWNLVVKQLETFKAEGFDANAILETSIRSNWTDVYRPKDKGAIGRMSATTPQTDVLTEIRERNRKALEEVQRAG